MRTKIVFDFQLDGHNLEYIHHLYVGAIKQPDIRYIFLLPYEFDMEKNILEWPEASNINFEYFNKKEVWSKSILLTSLKSCIYLRKKIKKYGACEIILVWLMNVIPFIQFFMPKGVTVSGIIYKIYLYTWNSLSWKEKIANAIKYFTISRSHCIQNAYILNDTSSVAVLNRTFKTNVFKYLPDPFVAFDKAVITDLRTELKIDCTDIVCLHQGAMSNSKGTLEVLDIIENSSKEDLVNYTFIFAGTFAEQIKDKFYSRVQELKSKVKIIVKEGFLPYEYMGSLVYTSDKIILPYKRVDASSGTIAYASQFKKQVYVPNKGLLGKLVRKYNIGITLNVFSTINDLSQENKKNNTYCESHTVDQFNKILLGK